MSKFFLIVKSLEIFSMAKQARNKSGVLETRSFREILPPIQVEIRTSAIVGSS